MAASFSRDDVLNWATRANLSEESIRSLRENEVDGPTLLTLSKQELQTELGISSLPARRYIWDLIKNLRVEQGMTDFSTAIEAHEEEINTFAVSSFMKGPDVASGTGDAESKMAILNGLQEDSRRQRLILQDHLLAHRLQRALDNGQEVYEDAELARQEQQRLNNLREQAESDRRYAQNLSGQPPPPDVDVDSDAASRAGEEGTNENRIRSLFGLCVQTCVDNKTNVAEAFRSGKMKPSAVIVSDSDSDEEDSKTAAADIPPTIDTCDVCYEEDVEGYYLGCGHKNCVNCTQRLFRTALRDSSLLPLRCCEIPMDMNVASYVLEDNEAHLLRTRVSEASAKSKMHCPSCSKFFNLDLIDASFASELLCSCGTELCVECKTKSHPGTSCDENLAAHARQDEEFLSMARDRGWKQCPSCASMIELRSGCNHLTCSYCHHEFCYVCLQRWNSASGQCSSGRCEVWDEERLEEAGEERVCQQEAQLGQAIPMNERRRFVHAAMAGLRANEVCNHTWGRRDGYQGDCPNCGFEMNLYGMHCYSDCGSTVCYTCAHHRIPQRGWR